MIVVADTSPINYLVLVGQIGFCPAFTPGFRSHPLS